MTYGPKGNDHSTICMNVQQFLTDFLLPDSFSTRDSNGHVQAHNVLQKSFKAILSQVIPIYTSIKRIKICPWSDT